VKIDDEDGHDQNSNLDVTFVPDNYKTDLSHLFNDDDDEIFKVADHLSSYCSDDDNAIELVKVMNSMEEEQTECSPAESTPVKQQIFPVSTCSSSSMAPPSPCASNSSENEFGPMCFCPISKPTVRRIGGPESKIAGRPYWGCVNRNRCRFFQLLPSNSPKKDQSKNEKAEALKKSLHNLKLPTQVKHKGRPRGVAKTNVKYQKTGSSNKKPPKGAFATPFEAVQQRKQMRELKAQQIPGSAVQEFAHGVYYVESATTQGQKYRVTENSYSCPDNSFRKNVCKHILRVREEMEGSMSGTTVASIEHSRVCCTCGTGEPSHNCNKCRKPVHAIYLCSSAIGDGEDEEGYSKPRLCLSCTAKPTVQGRKRKMVTDDFNVIEEAPLQSDNEDAFEPASQSRYGRNIRKKKIFTPTKNL
ncbi:UPF0051 protein ycf24, partial [Frankliniella fusca]